MTSLCALRDNSRTLPHFEIVAVEPLLGVLNSLLIVIAGHLFRRSCDLIVVSQHVELDIPAYRAPGLRRKR